MIQAQTPPFDACYRHPHPEVSRKAGLEGSRVSGSHLTDEAEFDALFRSAGLRIRGLATHTAPIMSRVFVAIAVVLVAGWIGIIVVQWRGEPQPASEAQPAPEPEPVFEDITPSRDVTPPRAQPWPRPEGPVERLPDQEPPPLPPKPPKPDVLARATVVAAGRLRAGNQYVRLAHIETKPLDATCTDENGTDWPCGQAGATAFRMLVRGRALTCAPLQEDAPDHAPRTCSIGQVDLAEWLLRQGWATPAPGAPDTYREAHEDARKKQRGLFTRKWEYR